MEFLFDYLGFLAKVATIVVAIVVVIGAIASAGHRRAQRQHKPRGHIEVTPLNDVLRDMRHVLEHALTPHAEYRKRMKAEKAAAKAEEKARLKAWKRERKRLPAPAEASAETKAEVAAEATAEALPAEVAKPAEGQAQGDKPRRRIFVIDFDGDPAASGVDGLRHEVTAVLAAAGNEDEVVVRLQSAGGMVQGYGLGASQLARFRTSGVNLVVAVDKVAASGGYMMAAVANTILAAPFALVGSIGVVAQLPNINRLLKKHDVDVELHTAGRYKRTLTVFGENTEEARAKFLEELNDIHAMFQEFVGEFRPGLDLEAVSTGEAWAGQRALDRALVDRLVTSDEYLAGACDEADVFEVRWVLPQTPIERAMERFSDATDKVVERLMGAFSRWG